MNVNFGLLPPLRERIKNKRERKQALAQRALRAMENWRAEFAPLFS
jgi:methylenetetrahydrofolate--tRNA-(uracil-5-)-methyltransferase